MGDFANVASRALQATASMENAQKSLGHTLATESGEEADDAQKGRVRRRSSLRMLLADCFSSIRYGQDRRSNIRRQQSNNPAAAMSAIALNYRK